MSAQQGFPPRRRTMLLILDGFGVNPSKRNNAVLEAHTPRLDAYFESYPHTVLDASGPAVGLPPGQMGNSEVGHVTIGCGTILRQDLVRIDHAIEDGNFFDNHAFINAIRRTRESERPLHLLGMVSDGGVHSHIKHLLALIELCRRRQVRPIVHMITDGRDTAPRHAKNDLAPLEKKLKEADGALATISGRYYAMDRDKRWERTEKAWRALVELKGEKADSAAQAIDDAYDKGKGDEFILPTILTDAQRIEPGDSVIFFNFRNDRPRQLTKALTARNFTEFDRGEFRPVNVTTLTEYDTDYPCPVAFLPERPAVTIGQIVSEAGLKQLHCAETEKYPHVTFFINGGRETAFDGEKRIMVPSPKVATYDLQPEMSAERIADELIDALKDESYALYIVNFANGDMVGHTAIREAILTAVQVLDEQAGRVLDVAVANEVSVLLTADHGNCDEMIDPVSRQPHTQHSLYPVPCLIIDKSNWRLATGAGLSSVAPTVLQLLGLPQPLAMKGTSLLLEELERTAS
ncbi:MAG: 2,3-bisphosphoglycerate-independent phosphoglycerate mutase [Gammaproteobacteria bacterium]